MFLSLHFAYSVLEIVMIQGIILMSIRILMIKIITMIAMIMMIMMNF